MRVVAGDGIAEWHQPLGVDYARLAGARETTNVALVTLLDPLRQPVEVLRGVTVDAVVSSLRTAGPRAPP
ncbi:MAG: hypothetical protein R2734_12530 [Nocardioides sp.]